MDDTRFTVIVRGNLRQVDIIWRDASSQSHELILTVDQAKSLAGNLQHALDFVTDTPTAATVLQRARLLAAAVETWADFLDLLFAPDTGVVATAFPDRHARERFMRTPEYFEIVKLFNDLIERTGLIEGATPRMKSGGVR